MLMGRGSQGKDQMLDMDDFHVSYVMKALQQGWCLSELDVAGNGRIQVQKVDDPERTSLEYGVPVPELWDDADAVNQLKAAYVRGEDHALAAYRILQLNSPMEFQHWQMMSWLALRA
jgi:hypothetical protein